MSSVEVPNEDPTKDESETFKLNEIHNTFEYYNNYSDDKEKKKEIICKIIILVLFILVVCIFFTLNIKKVDIIYEDRTNIKNLNMNYEHKSEQILKETNNSDLSNKKKDDNIIINDKIENENKTSKEHDFLENNTINQNYINNNTYINNTNNNINDTTYKNIYINIYNNTNNNNNTDNNETKKIGLAFVYSTLYSNGIARFITVTANNLMKTGKYEICFITGNRYQKEYNYHIDIKRFIGHNNFTLIKKLSQTQNIDIFILQNTLSVQTINFYKSLGKKVIGIFHGVYMSAMFHGIFRSYRNWINFDLYDSYVFIAADDYFFYKKLGFKNEIYIPNLYTFEPSQVKNSNLTYHNIMMLGRQNDPIKGAIYAVKAMSLIVKEVPDARLTLITSDSRIQFLRNLTVELNLTNNIFFIYHTYDISKYFWNSSVHMFTSLSEAFPMAMNEGKAHGLPIVAFDVPYSPPYQNGVIVVDQLDVESLAKETIKLLKDYNYRKKMGEFAKKSLDNYSNKETVELWERLCKALLSSDRNDYKKLQEEIEKKYYNEESARKHMQKHYDALLRYNKKFSCHTLDNFTDIHYVKNIQECNMNYR